MGASFGMGMQLGQGLIGAFASGGSSTSNYAAQMPFNPMQGVLDLQGQMYEDEAQLQEKQGRIALDEAGDYAAQVSREAHKHREQQAVDYSNSGVLISGTPATVMNETVALAGQEIDAIMKRGVAQSDLFRRRANITRNQGRAALLGANTEFNTRNAQARMASINANGGSIGNALLGICNALSGIKGSGQGFSFGFGQSQPMGGGFGASWGSTRSQAGSDSLLYTGSGFQGGRNTFGFNW